MKNNDFLNKLNEQNNFHLTFKVIQITDNTLLEYAASKTIEKNVIINSENDIYEQLKNAYENKVRFVFIDEKIDCLLPFYVCLTIPYIDIIKPLIPVLYTIKDNKEKEYIKTACRKKMTTWQEFKTSEEMVEYLINKIN